MKHFADLKIDKTWKQKQEKERKIKMYQRVHVKGCEKGSEDEKREQMKQKLVTDDSLNEAMM